MSAIAGTPKLLKQEVEHLRAEIERLAANYDATIRELFKATADNERLQDTILQERTISHNAARKREAEIERLQAVAKAADTLRSRWLHNGHELREPSLSDFRTARDAYDKARAALDGKA